MLLTRKCQYALRAIFELAKRYGGEPATVADIAAAQACPARFLETILGQLKGGGFVESRRGPKGGYALVRSPEGLSVGEVVRFVQGPIGPVHCQDGGSGAECPLGEGCVFYPLWEEARDALMDTVNRRTFRDLLEQEKRRPGPPSADFSI